MASDRLPLETIELIGYKSIQRLDRMPLNRGLNVLIGANGSGKSNFIKFFEMLGCMMQPEPSLQNYIVANGGAEAFLFRGSETTPELSAHLRFGLNEYTFTLKAAADGQTLFFSQESAPFDGPRFGPVRNDQGSGHKESALATKRYPTKAEQFVVDTLRRWKVYHFHNTSANAPLMKPVNIVDSGMLERDARNIAPFLLQMKKAHPEHYRRIVGHIQLAAPYFGDFELKDVGNGKTQLLWRERYASHVYYPSQLSDGSIRFICLATLLLQPTPPADDSHR